MKSGHSKVENRQKEAILSCWHRYYCCKTSCLLRSVWKGAVLCHIPLTKLSKLYMVVCSYFVSLGKWQKSYIQAPLLHSWTQHSGSPQSPTQGDTVHSLSEKHACPSKNKSPFLNASSSRFLAFSVVNTAQMWQLEWNSFLDLSSSTKWWLCVQSFFLYSPDDSLIPFFGFRSPLFPFQHFSFNFCIATSVNFQHI